MHKTRLKSINRSQAKVLLFVALVPFMFSCQNSTETTRKEKVAANPEVTQPNFDPVLKCATYTYEENYFFTADAGCLYQPKGANTFGNLVIYLIPKKPVSINEDHNDSETKRVNNLSIAQLKTDFTIYVYLIDSKYLNYNPEGDPVYYQKDHFVEALYTYDRKGQKWNFIDTFRISGADNTTEQNRRAGFIQKQAGQSEVNQEAMVTAGKISEKWYGKYRFSTNKDQEDWRTQQDIELDITKDGIVYHAEGYQIDQTYTLSGKEIGGALVLNYLSAADHTESAVLAKTKDFGTIICKNKNCTWSSPYLDQSFGNGKNTIYRLTKK